MDWNDELIWDDDTIIRPWKRWEVVAMLAFALTCAAILCLLPG